MTTQELINILQQLPPGMEVVIQHGFNDFISVCREKCEIIRAEKDGLQEDLLLLNPCNCDVEVSDLLNNLPLN